MLTLILALLLHPVHETVSEIEWNADTGRLEVALRLDVLDEEWLEKRFSRNRETKAWAIGYLRQAFRITEPVKGRMRDTASYHWVGREQKGAYVWWYFEIEPNDARPPDWIEHRVLFERADGYSNQVLVIHRSPRTTVTLTPDRPRAKL